MKEGIGVGRQERMADVVALGDGGCELFELSRHDFRDIVKRYVSGCVRPCVCVRVFVRSPPPPGARSPFQKRGGEGVRDGGEGELGRKRVQEGDALVVYVRLLGRTLRVALCNHSPG